MAEPDAEQMRRKRVVKLEALRTQAASKKASDDASPSTPDVAKEATSSAPAKSVGSETASSSSPKPGLKRNAENQDPSATAAGVMRASQQSQGRESSKLSMPLSKQEHQETLQEWEDRTLCTLFRFTLKPDQKKDTHGNTLALLETIRTDLLERNEPLLINTTMLDEALVESTVARKPQTPFGYLLACFKRVSRQLRGHGAGGNEQKLNILKEAKRLCMSYCVFAITMPDMFEDDQNGTYQLTEHLLADPDSDRGVCQDFLTEAVARFKDDETVQGMIVDATIHLSQKLAALSMNDDYRPYVTALRTLVRFSPVVAALAESDYFLPQGLAAQDIEKKSLLGPLFQLSPLQGEVAENYFSAPRTRDRGYIANSQNALRLTLQQHQDSLFYITDQFIRGSKESREQMLDWLAATVNLNHKRRAMRTDPRYVSSDGFMVNITVVLDRLCEPFMDLTFSKLHRIEVDYLRRNPRIAISDETKINADQPTSDKFYAEKAPGTSNFISEAFFLTVAAHHYGTEAANSKLGDLRRNLRSMEKELSRFEAEREKYVNGAPAVLTLFDSRLKQFKAHLDRGYCVLHATEGVLLDEQLQGRAMLFMRYIIAWLMRIVSGVEYPKQEVSLPLPKEQPEVFKCLPEYFVEDVVDHFKFVTSHMPQVITPSQCDELIAICLTFLRSSDYIKNPHLKSGLVAILYYGVMPTRTAQNGVLGNVLNTSKFALKHLLHGLMQFYIECESLGTHNQFYDKFNIRYEISQVIKCIWGNAVYREQLADQAKLNLDFFVRFVNMLLNDATWVLDESFTAFSQITSLEKELRLQGESMTEEVRKEKDDLLEQTKSKAKSYMGLTTESLSMLRLFTDALADSFTMPEIVQRLADMLDYNLEALVGPKQTQLKVEHREEYNFDPMSLLAEIVDVYLNLSHKPLFHLAIARDGRSYKPDNFAKAKAILMMRNRKSSEELARLKTLGDAVEKAKAADDAEEEDLGEIPDEFTDPIMGILMKDPVILPTSKNTVDRSTIRGILLNDGLDPFNRAKLTMEDVQDNVDLKNQIDAWIQERKAAVKRNPPEEAEPMDTT